MNSFTFHEPKQHGTSDFPFEYYYIDISHPRYNMAFHWHKEWEIIHILKGSFTIYADDIEYPAKEGDILLVRDGMLHGGTPDQQDCVYECFLFDLHDLFRNLDMVKKYLRPVYQQQILPSIYYPSGSFPELEYIIFTLSNANRQAETDSLFENPLELVVIGSISQLFALILQKGFYTNNPFSPMESTRKVDLIRTVLEYIELHYASHLTLGDLAAAANMSPKYFCRFFHSITHQTPVNYLNMYRVEKAAQMLHGTKLPIVDICMECGFNDSSHFIKVFRKYKGMTPKQYRKG